MRSQCIRDLAFEHLKDGLTTAETARIIKVHQTTIQRWQREGRVCKAPAKHRINRRKLSQEQEKAVLDGVRSNPGMQLKTLVKHVSDAYNLTITTRTASSILKRGDVTRKRGTKMNIKYQIEKGVKFLEDLRQCYRPLLTSFDGCSFMLNLAPSYGWARRGERAVIPQPGKRTVSYSLLLCISPVGVLNWSLRSGTIDSLVFSEFLGKLPNGITLILDNARIHHATNALIKQGLLSIKQLADSKTITLKYAPPYASESRRVLF